MTFTTTDKTVIQNAIREMCKSTDQIVRVTKLEQYFFDRFPNLAPFHDKLAFTFWTKPIPVQIAITVDPSLTLEITQDRRKKYTMSCLLNDPQSTLRFNHIIQQLKLDQIDTVLNEQIVKASRSFTNEFALEVGKVALAGRRPTDTITHLQTIQETLAKSLEKINEQFTLMQQHGDTLRALLEDPIHQSGALYTHLCAQIDVVIRRLVAIAIM